MTVSKKYCMCMCISLFVWFQGYPGPVGTEGAEGKPGTQVPIL